MKNNLRLGIMQPYFFPYIEYFRLISNSDLWIAFDTVKYNKKSWMSRNRILNKDKGWSYINVPISKADHGVSVRKARVVASADWRGRIFGKLGIYKRSAPHYSVVVRMLNDIFDEEHVGLASLNLSALAHLCRFLEIDTKIVALSELSLDLPNQCPPGEWALYICKAVGAKKYINASGGRELFDPDLYRRAGIDLTFHGHIDFRYDTGPFEFVPDLSIVDALMWVGAETVRDAVHRGHSD